MTNIKYPRQKCSRFSRFQIPRVPPPSLSAVFDLWNPVVLKTWKHKCTPRIGNGLSFETLVRGEGILNATSSVFSNLQAIVLNSKFYPCMDTILKFGIKLAITKFSY